MFKVGLPHYSYDCYSMLLHYKQQLGIKQKPAVHLCDTAPLQQARDESPFDYTKKNKISVFFNYSQIKLIIIRQVNKKRNAIAPITFVAKVLYSLKKCLITPRPYLIFVETRFIKLCFDILR